MRGACALVAACAVLAVSSPAAAAAAETAETLPPPAAGAAHHTVCTVTDGRVTELSGMAAGGGRLYVMNDGGHEVRVYVLSRDCSVRDVVTSGIDPYDPEDLALAADGTLWVGDIGDNSRKRSTIALITIAPDGASSLYRLTYPDGPHDAEALVLGPGGIPYVITKNVLGPSGVYRPVGPLESPGPTPLRRVARIELGPTDTPGGPLPDGVGSVLVTGAALSHDGTVLAVRTYTDAYLYAVPHGDIAAALSRPPRRVPLPREPQGEAVAFGRDRALLIAGEGTDQPIVALPHATTLVRDGTRAAPRPRAGRGAPAEAASSPAAAGPGSPWWYLGAGGIALAGAVTAWSLVARRRRG